MIVDYEDALENWETFYEDTRKTLVPSRYFYTIYTNGESIKKYGDRLMGVMIEFPYKTGTYGTHFIDKYFKLPEPIKDILYEYICPIPTQFDINVGEHIFKRTIGRWTTGGMSEIDKSNNKIRYFPDYQLFKKGFPLIAVPYLSDIRITFKDLYKDAKLFLIHSYDCTPIRTHLASNRHTFPVPEFPPNVEGVPLNTLEVMYGNCYLHYASDYITDSTLSDSNRVT